MSYIEKLAEYLRSSKLYEKAGEDLEQLIEYMSVRIEEGSLAYLFGFKQIQVKFEDELPWLAGSPSLYPNPPLDEAAKRVREMRVTYEMSLQMLICSFYLGDVERLLQESMDMVDQYYVRIDAREKSVEPYIEKKPETFEEMNRLARSDMGFRIVQSAWREAYGDLFGLYFLREQVGFDRAQFNVDIVSVDVEKLMRSKEALKGKSYNELPRIIFEYIDPDDETDLPVDLPIENNHFKKIEVTLSHHVAFIFQRNNSPIEDGGKKKKDIYLLKTTVEPLSGYEVLGNLGNYSYEEMKGVIRTAAKELYETTGIQIDSSSVRLNDIEINLTFRQTCGFNDLVRSVSYYQNYTRKGYVTREFKTADEGIVHFCSGTLDRCTTEDQIKKKKKRISAKYSRMKTTGFTTSSQSLTVKLYDKREETIAYAASQGYDLKIEGDEAIIRLEFRIRNRDQLKRYFGTGDNPVYFLDLSQEEIEKAYVRLVDIFFKKSYEEGYVPESMKALSGIVASLDTSSKGGKWKQQLINAILSQEIWQKSTPALLTEKDIASAIPYNHTFARQPNRYKKIIWEILKESNVYKKGQEHAYDMLFNFLNKTYNLRTLSSARRVGYAVSMPGDNLPDMEEKIKDILCMRAQWEKLQNMGQDDFEESPDEISFL